MVKLESCSKKTKMSGKDCDQCLDKISKLPQEVTNAILERMPLRDAVRTSVLSKCWRHRWTTIPNLVFDRNTLSSRGSFPSLIYWVFLFYRGPIHRFELNCYNLSKRYDKIWSISDVDVWIGIISTLGLKELVLDVSYMRSYELPSCLFSCETITYLNLKCCCFAAPKSFSGFRNLKTLIFKSGKATKSLLSLLISNSLEEFILDASEYETGIIVRAPKLVRLFVCMPGADYIHLENAPLLTSTYINLHDNYLPRRVEYNTAKAFGCLPRIQDLKLLGRTLEVMAGKEVPSSLPILYQLKTLAIAVNFQNAKEVYAALLLLRSSPLLWKLDVTAYLNMVAIFQSLVSWNEQGKFSSSFSSLRIVNMTDFEGRDNELNFVKYLLANSPNLEKFVIKFDHGVSDHLSISKKLNSFKRQSANVAVVL